MIKMIECARYPFLMLIKHTKLFNEMKIEKANNTK